MINIKTLLIVAGLLCGGYGASVLVSPKAEIEQAANVEIQRVGPPPVKSASRFF